MQFVVGVLLCFCASVLPFPPLFFFLDSNSESFTQGTRGQAALLQGKEKIKLLKLSQSILVGVLCSAGNPAAMLPVDRGLPGARGPFCFDFEQVFFASPVSRKGKSHEGFGILADTPLHMSWDLRAPPRCCRVPVSAAVGPRSALSSAAQRGSPWALSCHPRRCHPASLGCALERVARRYTCAALDAKAKGVQALRACCSFAELLV